MLSTLLTSLIISSSAFGLFETGHEDFDFYLGELVLSELPDDDPMHELIVEYLAESVFYSESKTEFYAKLHTIQKTAKAYPERLVRFRSLDRELQQAFEDKLKQARKKRWLYAAGGAVVGALIGFPVGRAISQSTSVLWIAIPTGALAGGGAGFLLGSLLSFPDYKYEPGMIDRDLENQLDDLGL